MGPWLNKIICGLLLCLFVGENLLAQQTTSAKTQDYKDKDQFKKFLKRRRVIGAWQINELKKGALVVRLKTNARLIESLKAQGNTELANKKYFENYVTNKNLMMAYKKHYNFSQIYFIYSHSSDSLLKGHRSGIFLDTNLRIDPLIEMKETFYLIAERDYVFNSSIGFVPIDSADKQIERGNPGTEMFVVLKNKFGHQLKEPFPYSIGDGSFIDLSYQYLGTTNAQNNLIWFPYENVKQEIKIKKSFPENQVWVKFELKKRHFEEKMALSVQQLNLNLKDYYQASPPPDLSRLDPEIKMFLY